MKNLLKKISILSIIIAIVSISVSIFTPTSTYAIDEFKGRTTNCTFLGFTSWDCNVIIKDENSLKTGIWQIVSNIALDVTVAASYLAIGFVIYGGYRYIFSGGDPNKVASGKKTLSQALLGLAITISASVIMGAIRIAITSGSGNIGNCDLTSDSGAGCLHANTAGNMVTELINWVTGVAGVVSAIFIVYGGISYITSAGDPSKVEKAKKTILYALIGLVVVALVTIITGFVGKTVRDATSQIDNPSTIAKEVNEINVT